MISFTFIVTPISKKRALLVDYYITIQGTLSFLSPPSPRPAHSPAGTAHLLNDLYLSLVGCPSLFCLGCLVFPRNTEVILQL